MVNMNCLKIAFLLYTWLLGHISAISLSNRAGGTGNFQAYAYGDGIGGLPVFSTGFTVYIGNSTSINSSDAAPVIFTKSSTNLTSNPNTTASSSSTPSWSNLLFAIPAPSSPTHTVALVSPTNITTDTVTSGFTFYGHFIFVSESGSLQSLFYALPTDTDDVWSLNWNSTSDETAGKVLVSLRDVMPSNGGDVVE
ncbi:hypothetical protein CONLIGDRAFT_673947 [Coniochaeta ligniaria NRRL 30616]|uniref:Uncharacterized protein n=1 Tax=Coniochaeta ligniaria NRRL 30616 TaxID=1408157 RepID=A0A1J7I8E0_9PEZI|nr:hypothetical protein CONLIGDRAFT_673947 [Coniochaeta ligniaria NRRL 30616]